MHISPLPFQMSYQFKCGFAVTVTSTERTISATAETVSTLLAKPKNLLDDLKLRDACGLVQKIVPEKQLGTNRLNTQFTWWEGVRHYEGRREVVNRERWRGRTFLVSFDATQPSLHGVMKDRNIWQVFSETLGRHLNKEQNFLRDPDEEEMMLLSILESARTAEQPTNNLKIYYESLWAEFEKNKA
jgi:hypothetical protein